MATYSTVTANNVNNNKQNYYKIAPEYEGFKKYSVTTKQGNISIEVCPGEITVSPSKGKKTNTLGDIFTGDNASNFIEQLYGEGSIDKKQKKDMEENLKGIFSEAAAKTDSVISAYPPTEELLIYNNGDRFQLEKPYADPKLEEIRKRYVGAMELGIDITDFALKNAESAKIYVDRCGLPSKDLEKEIVNNLVSMVHQLENEFGEEGVVYVGVGNSAKLSSFALKAACLPCVTLNSSEVKEELQPTDDFKEYIKRKVGKLGGNIKKIVLLDTVVDGNTLRTIKRDFKDLFPDLDIKTAAIGHTHHRVEKDSTTREWNSSDGIDFFVKNTYKMNNFYNIGRFKYNPAFLGRNTKKNSYKDWIEANLKQQTGSTSYEVRRNHWYKLLKDHFAQHPISRNIQPISEKTGAAEEEKITYF